jgi:hypothetical protein
VCVCLCVLVCVSVCVSVCECVLVCVSGCVSGCVLSTSSHSLTAKCDFFPHVSLSLTCRMALNNNMFVDAALTISDYR